MNYTEIKNELRATGCSFQVIADALSKSVNSVREVAKRNLTSKEIAGAICVALKKPVEEVFPDKPSYNEDYNPEIEHKNKVQELKEKLAQEKAVA